MDSYKNMQINTIAPGINTYKSKGTVFPVSSGLKNAQIIIQYPKAS